MTNRPQSDIPSQEGGRTARGFAAIPPELSQLAPTITEQISANAFTVATYESRPPNSFDCALSSTDRFNNVAGYLGNPEGVRITTPENSVFVARLLSLSISIAFQLPPPYAAPAGTFRSDFITDVNGMPNLSKNNPVPAAPAAPLYSLSIAVNGSLTTYASIALPNLPYSDINLPLFLPIDPGSNVDILLFGSALNGGLYLPTAQMRSQVVLIGNLIPDLGLQASEITVNTQPLAVTR